MKSRISLLALLLLTIAVSGVPAHAAPVAIDRLEASVNSTLILLSDVHRFRKNVGLRAQLDPLFSGTSIASKGAKATDEEIVQFLIDEKIISQQFQVTDAEVEQEINSILANNHIDRAVLKNTLREQGFSFDDYFELIRSSAAKRNLIDRDIRTKVSVSDDDIKNYYFNKISKGSAPLSYRVQIIVVSPKNYKNSAAAKEVADRALKALKGGEAFEEVAKRVSDDATAQSGGELGTLSEEHMSPLIRDQLKKLKVGQFSDVLGNPAGGFFILKLADVTTGESDRFEKMKEEIRAQLAASEYQHQIALWLERQRQNAFVHRAGQASVAGLPATR